MANTIPERDLTKLVRTNVRAFGSQSEPRTDDEIVEEAPDQAAALRKLWKKYCKACELRSQIWAAQDYTGTPPPDVPFPIELTGLTCGAKTRAGKPCKRRDLYASGRCKLHGGLSTGPRRKLTP